MGKFPDWVIKTETPKVGVTVAVEVMVVIKVTVGRVYQSLGGMAALL